MTGSLPFRGGPAESGVAALADLTTWLHGLASPAAVVSALHSGQLRRKCAHYRFAFFLCSAGSAIVARPGPGQAHDDLRADGPNLVSDRDANGHYAKCPRPASSDHRRGSRAIRRGRLMPIPDDIERRSIWRRAMDAVFGYDFFISYSWLDGRTYAAALMRRLELQGFQVFLDRNNYASVTTGSRSAPGRCGGPDN